MVGAFSGQGFALADAQQRALAVLDATMMRQAAMQAYNDAWLLLLASFVCVVPGRFPASRSRARRRRRQPRRTESARLARRAGPDRR